MMSNAGKGRLPEAKVARAANQVQNKPQTHPKILRKHQTLPLAARQQRAATSYVCLLGRQQFQKHLLSDDPWEKLLLEQEFRNAINENGYYQYPLSFPDYKKKYLLALTRQTPSYLSIDFWSDQSPTLRKGKLYVIRTGKGRFAIFSEDRFGLC